MHHPSKPTFLQHFIWQPTISLLARLWHFIWWLWAGVLVGVIANFVYTYITTCTPKSCNISITDLHTWPIVQSLLAHPLLTIVAFILAIIIMISAYLAHCSEYDRERHNEINEYVLKRVKDLDPNDYIYPYVKEVYLRRQDLNSKASIDAIVQEEIHKVAFRTGNSPLQKPLGICIFGRPTQGKTRLAWEAIRAVLPLWTLVKWPHERQHAFDFTAQYGRNIILWLDDLHEFANPNEALTIEDLPRRFHESTVSLIIVATCRDGDNEIQTRLYLEDLLERFTEIHLTDISPTEADQLTTELMQHGIATQRSQFDGTPGSLLLGVDRMRNQRYPALPKPAKQVLKAMKLLHSAGIYAYSTSRVRTIAVDLFALNQQDWRDACDILARESFIRLESDTVDNSPTLIPITDIYLERAVPDYPPPSADITDDWSQLLENLILLQDAFALNSLGIAYSDRSLGDALKNHQYAEKCFRAALKFFVQNADQINAAITQNLLGETLLAQARLVSGASKVSLLNQATEVVNDSAKIIASVRETAPTLWIMLQRNVGRILKDSAESVEVAKQLDLLQQAAQAFNTGLQSYSQEIDPKIWAMLQNELGLVLSRQFELTENTTVQSNLIQQAVTAFHAALTIETKEQSPTSWAGTQANLATALNLQAGISEGTERIKLLEQAIDAFRASLEIGTQENDPEVLAASQVNLGSALRDRAMLAEKDEQQRLLQQSITSYWNILTTITKKSNPSKWAMIQHNLALSLGNLADLAAAKVDRLNLLQGAAAAYRAALEIYTPEYNPNTWAMTQNNLANTLNQQAGLVDTKKEQLNLVQQAIIAFQAILEVYTLESTPSRWAIIQNNLGSAYQELAKLVEGNEKLNLLEQAVAACHAALSVRIRERNPIEWAMTEHNMGNALSDQAKLTNDNNKRRTLLEQVAEAYKSALEVYTYESDPSSRAMIQSKLGNTLFNLLDITNQTEQFGLLQSAMIAYQAVLHVYMQEDDPKFWAATQSNLGAILHSLAKYADPAKGLDLLQQAIAAFDGALLVITQENDPDLWATTQFRLARALCDFWFVNPVKGLDLLQQAIAACNGALLVITRENNPDSWEEIQFKLALLHATLPYFEENKVERCNALNQASNYIDQLLLVIGKETDKAHDPMELGKTIKKMKQEYGCSSDEMEHQC